MADKTYTLDSGTTKGKFVDIGNSLFAKADVPLVKTASGLYLPFPITDAGYYPAVLQAGSDVVGKVGIDQTIPGTTNKVVAELSAGTALAGKFVPVDTDGDEKFTAGNPASVQLSGSIPEYAWFTGAEQPIPADQAKFAWGYEFDETTGEISAYGWSGAAWVKVVI